MKIKTFYIIFIILISAFVLQGQGLVDKYFQNAKGSYIIKDYEKAHYYINFVLKYYKNDTVPPAMQVYAEKIYHDYIKILIEKENYETLEKVSKDVQNYSVVASDRVTKIINDIKKKIEEKKRKTELEEEFNKKMEEQRALEEKYRKRRLKDEEKLRQREERLLIETAKKEVEARETLSNVFQNIMISKDKETSKSMKMIFYIVIIVIIVFILIFLGIILIIFVFIKHSQIQQQKVFEYSIRTNLQPTNLLTIPTEPTGEQNTRMLEDKTNDLKDKSQKDMLKFKKLLEKCHSYAVEIDDATARKNNSKNIAEIVYKISKHINHEEFESMLFYAVALVYDIGFINIDHDLLQSESLSEEQFEEIKKHTKLGLNMVHFVDPQYKNLFKEAILKHHEHLDGSGYPDGIKDSDIPYIARVVRVAETFCAMTSKRVHKKIKDKTTALKELRKEQEKYDINIVNALEEII